MTCGPGKTLTSFWTLNVYSCSQYNLSYKRGEGLNKFISALLWSIFKKIFVELWRPHMSMGDFTISSQALQKAQSIKIFQY